MAQSELTKMQRNLNEYYSMLQGIANLGEQLEKNLGEQQAFEVMRKELAGEVIKLSDKLEEHNNLYYLPSFSLSVMIDESRRVLETQSYRSMQTHICELQTQLLTVLYWTNGPTFGIDKWMK